MPHGPNHGRLTLGHSAAVSASRSVPAELHSVIAARANAASLTISPYLLRRLIQIEGKPGISDVLARHWEKTAASKHAAPGTAAAILAEDRDR